MMYSANSSGVTPATLQLHHQNNNNYYNNINNKYILIINHSDLDFPELLGDDPNKYINDEKCIHIFAQNSSLISDKVTHLPIGLDYHTLAAREYYWGPKMTPKKQEEQLQTLKDASLPFFERKKVCYANFSLTYAQAKKYGYNRKNAINSVPSELIYFQEGKITRLDTWKKQSEYAFVISPLGNGLDCHRTWEALCLGCIVIVKTSPLDPMYEGLPVLIVNAWSDITQDLLNNTVNTFKEKAFNYDKLLLSYWVNKINSYKQTLISGGNIDYKIELICNTEKEKDRIEKLKNLIEFFNIIPTYSTDKDNINTHELYNNFNKTQVSSSEISLTINHITIFQKYNNKNIYTIIFESDVKPLNDLLFIQRELNNIIKEMKDNNIDIVFLGKGHLDKVNTSEYKKITDTIYKSNTSRCTESYIISPRCITKYLDFFKSKNNNITIDWSFNNFFKATPDINVGWRIPELFEQDKSLVSIIGKNRGHMHK